MKKLSFLIICLLFLNCKSSYNEAAKTEEDSVTTTTNEIQLEASGSSKFVNLIKKEAIKEKVMQFSADSMQGRSTGENGQKKAAEFLRNTYKNLGISSPKGFDYFQNIPMEYFNGRSEKDSENVIAIIEGSTKPNEYLILSAHYDHIGMDDDGLIYNGADDNASGTIGLVEIANAFNEAKKKGKGPKRSIVFLHVTGEEIGLYGSKYYTENPIFPLTNTVADLNVDMIGRVDDKHLNDPNYIYLIGSDRLSQDLHDISEAVNKKYEGLNFDYTFNAKNDPNRFYYRSDHYNFAKNDIPIIFYFNGVHDDYHEATDTVDKINFELLTKRSQLIFYTAWELANREEKPRLNEQ